MPGPRPRVIAPAFRAGVARQGLHRGPIALCVRGKRDADPVVPTSPGTIPGDRKSRLYGYEQDAGAAPLAVRQMLLVLMLGDDAPTVGAAAPAGTLRKMTPMPPPPPPPPQLVPALVPATADVEPAPPAPPLPGNPVPVTLPPAAHVGTHF